MDDLVLQIEPLDDPWFEPSKLMHVSRGSDVWADIERPQPQLIAKWPSSYEPSFVRMIELPGDSLDQVLQAWSSDLSPGGGFAVDRHLVLRQPRREPARWSIAGRMRRPAPWRWVPVQMDLWPHLDQWTRLSLWPLSRVRVGRTYFRSGNRSLDRFTHTLLRSTVISSSASVPRPGGR